MRDAIVINSATRSQGPVGKVRRQAMSDIQCGVCLTPMATVAGYVDVAEYQHPLTIKGAKQICARCKGFIVSANGTQLLRQSFRSMPLRTE
jgi:hypothetical protein